jgi:hypothetical protein
MDCVEHVTYLWHFLHDHLRKNKLAKLGSLQLILLSITMPILKLNLWNEQIIFMLRGNNTD